MIFMSENEINRFYNINKMNYIKFLSLRLANNDSSISVPLFIEIHVKIQQKPNTNHQTQCQSIILRDWKRHYYGTLIFNF